MSLFSSLNRPPVAQSAFGASATAPFGQSQLQTQSQVQQQPQPTGSLSVFGQSQAPSQPGNSIWQPNNNVVPHTKPIPEQIALVVEKWEPRNPNCAFKTYFYNKVDESRVPFYQPQPGEDPKEWEEALQNKPAPGFIPVRCVGFAAMAERLKTQRQAVAAFNAKLHEINNCLDAILSRHDLETSVRALNARRRHAVLKKRCLSLAAKVQVLRNRGYALSSDEDNLKQKLQAIEREMADPAMSARMEELWSRLIVLRKYAESLKGEINKQGFGETEGLGEEVEEKVKKLLEDYEKQLQHLKKEVELIQKEFSEWEKSHLPADGASR